MRTRALILAGLLACLTGPGRADTVTITTGGPIEKLDADGHPSAVSMATVGATYTLVKRDGDNVILQDSTGAQYLIAQRATDYTAPAVAPAPATPPAPPVSANPLAGVPPPTPTPEAATATPSPDDAGALPALSKDDTDKIQQIDTALGFPLLADGSFWQDDVGQVADRLGWPQESKTTTQESYRRYAIKTQATVLGTAAYSMALYGKNDKPTYISIIFANAGDFAEARKLGDKPDPDAVEAVTKDLAVAVKKDAETITGTLTSVLGDPSVSLFGNSSSNRDEVHRWDWKDVAILLNTHDGEYASIKIIPTDAADHYGTVEVTDRDAMRDMLVQRVVKRDNGDVVISEIPMVDQGPKGYCVPATWERYLRYMDVPADLYVLAIMGHSGLGGGTSFSGMETGVDDYVSAYHRRIEEYDAPLDVSHVAKYIDQGLPLLWTCWVKTNVEIQTSQNTRDRKSVTDWPTYANTLVAQDTKLGDFVAKDPDHNNGHMRLIIGYNATTQEIAISDSWGKAAAERWMYIGTANKISQGQLGYLSW